MIEDLIIGPYVVIDNLSPKDKERYEDCLDEDGDTQIWFKHILPTNTNIRYEFVTNKDFKGEIMLKTIKDLLTTKEITEITMGDLHQTTSGVNSDELFIDQANELIGFEQKHEAFIGTCIAFTDKLGTNVKALYDLCIEMNGDPELWLRSFIPDTHNYVIFKDSSEHVSCMRTFYIGHDEIVDAVEQSNMTPYENAGITIVDDEKLAFLITFDENAIHRAGLKELSHYKIPELVLNVDAQLPTLKRVVTRVLGEEVFMEQSNPPETEVFMYHQFLWSVLFGNPQTTNTFVAKLAWNYKAMLFESFTNYSVLDEFPGYTGDDIRHLTPKEIVVKESYVQDKSGLALKIAIRESLTKDGVCGTNFCNIENEDYSLINTPTLTEDENHQHLLETITMNRKQITDMFPKISELALDIAHNNAALFTYIFPVIRGMILEAYGETLVDGQIIDEDVFAKWCVNNIINNPFAELQLAYETICYNEAKSLIDGVDLKQLSNMSFEDFGYRNESWANCKVLCEREGALKLVKDGIEMISNADSELWFIENPAVMLKPMMEASSEQGFEVASYPRSTRHPVVQAVLEEIDKMFTANKDMSFDVLQQRFSTQFTYCTIDTSKLSDVLGEEK